jgi:serine kinase of HPr protein (carbohydrate metabolism regulator)
MTDAPTIHASAVLIGAKAVLIRGPSGSGKSTLAWDIIQAGTSGLLPFARLVADDRAHIEVGHVEVGHVEAGQVKAAQAGATNGQLLVRPASALAGLIEIRGLGIRRLPYEPLAAVGLIVDLAAADADRMPGGESMAVTLAGIALPRLPVAPAGPALRQILAWLAETGGSWRRLTTGT